MAEGYYLDPFSQIVGFHFKSGGLLHFYFTVTLPGEVGTWEGHTAAEIAADPELLAAFEVFLGVPPGTIAAFAATLGLTIEQVVTLVLAGPSRVHLYVGELGKDIKSIYSSPTSFSSELFSSRSLNVTTLFYRDEDVSPTRLYLVDRNRVVTRLKNGDLDALFLDAVLAEAESWGAVVFDADEIRFTDKDATSDPLGAGVTISNTVFVSTQQNIYGRRFSTGEIVDVYGLRQNGLVYSAIAGPVVFAIARLFPTSTLHDFNTFTFHVPDEETPNVDRADFWSATNSGFVGSLTVTGPESGDLQVPAVAISTADSSFLFLLEPATDAGAPYVNRRITILRAIGTPSGGTVAYSLGRADSGDFFMNAGTGTGFSSTDMIATRDRAYVFYRFSDDVDQFIAVVRDDGASTVFTHSFSVSSQRAVGATKDHAYLCEALNASAPHPIRLYSESEIVFETDGFADLPNISFAGATADVAYFMLDIPGGDTWLLGSDGALFKMNDYLPAEVADASSAFNGIGWYAMQDRIYSLGSVSLNDGRLAVLHMTSLLEQPSGPPAPDVKLYILPEGASSMGLVWTVQRSPILTFQEFAAWSG